MRLLHNLFDSREQFAIQVRDLRLDFSHQCYLACHGEIHSGVAAQLSREKQMNLYSSSLQMIREVFNKYAPSYVISLVKSILPRFFIFLTMEKAILPLYKTVFPTPAPWYIIILMYGFP